LCGYGEVEREIEKPIEKLCRLFSFAIIANRERPHSLGFGQDVVTMEGAFAF
jgi:hypothetical protein